MKKLLLIHVLFLTGCIGIQSHTGKETRVCTHQCRIEYSSGSYIFPRDYSQRENHEINQSNAITKNNLLKYLGKPNNIQKSGQTETWTYTQTRWAGIIPYIIIPIPLVAPTGNDQVSIKFNNETFVEYTAQGIVNSYSMCSLIPVVADGGGFCWSKHDVSYYEKSKN